MFGFLLPPCVPHSTGERKVWAVRLEQPEITEVKRSRQDSWAQVKERWHGLGREDKLWRHKAEYTGVSFPAGEILKKIPFKTLNGKSAASSPMEKLSCLNRNSINNTSIIRKDWLLIKTHKSSYFIFTKWPPPCNFKVKAYFKWHMGLYNLYFWVYMWCWDIYLYLNNYLGEYIVLLCLKYGVLNYCQFMWAL